MSGADAELAKPKAMGDDEQKKAVDRWAVKAMTANGKPWSEKNAIERTNTVFMMSSKIFLVVLLLYMFIISLGLMGAAFKVVGGKTSGRVFRQSELFENPVAGISIGILATVLVQSSSTSTSIIITMAAADLLSLGSAIPMIMGANIGTAVTASIVSLAQVGNRDEYRRAFGGAIVHYCFNILTVVILLPVEVFTGLIERLSTSIVDAFGITDASDKGNKQDFLKIITKPISSRILQVDKKLVTKIAEELDPAKLAKLEKQSIITQGQSKDNHVFMDTPMSDEAAGVLLIIVSLLFLSVCLMLLVKTLQSVFRGRAAIWIGKMLNLELKSIPFLADYILMCFGAGLTILMQSSSVTTSTLTPLVGIGLIRVDKMFPFTIGANIGTTVTGVLAALASSNIKVGMQVAMSHLLFNVIGTCMWFMIPATRQVPLAMAKFFGSLAAEVQVFPVLLIVFAWVLAPVGLLLLAVVGVAACAVVGGLVGIVVLAVIILIWMRAYVPHRLPARLSKNFKWMPPVLRVEEEKSVGGTSGPVTAEQSEGPVDADMGSAKGWWQGPLAWGTGWFILMMLVVAVPNCQWGNLKYPKFDGRAHVGIGAWKVCSSMYESSQDWAPPRQQCTRAELEACGSVTRCNEGDLSDQAGANVKYEKSWLGCRTNCSLDAWKSYCLDMNCGGSLHTTQCANVTEAVHQAFEVVYQASSEKAWLAGDRCRDVSALCGNGDKLGQAGNLGWSGCAFAMLGQVLLIGFCTMRGKHNMFKALVGSLVSNGLAWILLLASWAVFTSAVAEETTCTIIDASDAGAVLASGKFGDIIKGEGSYSYALVLGAWCLMTLVVGVLVQRVPSR